MHGTLSCPVCGTTGIALGSPACPHCAVGFSAPVVAPTVQAAVQPSAHRAPMATATAVATAPATYAATPVDQWAPTMHAPATHATQPVAATATYGSIWRRMLAAIIDGIVVGIPFLLVMGPTEYFRMGDDAGGFYFIATQPWEYLEMAVFLVYVAAMQSSSKQATLGMQALDMRLVSEDGHGQVSFARAAGRDLLTYLSAAILCIGYLMIAFTAKRQALHDKLTNTVVLHDAK